jgi:hypothetical protein
VPSRDGDYCCSNASALFGPTCVYIVVRDITPALVIQKIWLVESNGDADVPVWPVLATIGKHVL